MAQNIFRNPIIVSLPTLTIESVGNGTLTIDKLTHFTINQSYTVICTATQPFTVFKVIGALDGAIGTAIVGQQFYDQDLKVFFTINQGPVLFEIGDTFEYEVDSGTDINRENINLYDELPQKNFGLGISGSLSGDNNIRYSETGLPASRTIQDLNFTAKDSGPEGNNISLQYLLGSILNAASKVIQDITYEANTAGEAGNDISVEYIEHVPGVQAEKLIQDITYRAVNVGIAGNSITITYIGGGTAGSEIVTVIGNDIQVQIEDGVSTVDQIRLAVGLHGAASALVLTLSGSPGGTPQAIQGTTNLENGSDPVGDAGNEVVTVTINAIKVQLESGVSTALQVRDAVLGSAPALTLVTPTITGGSSTVQTAPVVETFLEGGAENNGEPGNEVVEVIDDEIKVTFVSGLSTALQIKTALENNIDANALITIVLGGTGGEFQLSPTLRIFLAGGKEDGTFSFNATELTDSGNFYEGNANILASDVYAQGNLNVQKESSMNGKVDLDDSEVTNNSGLSINNVQKTINDLSQNDKIFVMTADHEKVNWTKPDLTFTSNIIIVLPDDGVINKVVVSESPIEILEGEHLFVELNRLNNDSILTPQVASQVSKGENFLRLASRIDDNLIWFDNTLQKDGKDIRIGEGGAGATAFQEKLGVGNGVQVNFPIISGLFPTSQESILVFSNLVSFVTTDWTYNVISNQIEFVVPPILGVEVYIFFLTEGESITVPSPSGVQQVEYRTITLAEELAKQLTLIATPAVPNKTIVDIIGGTAQEYAVDFTVSTNILDWNGLGLDGFLVEGNKLRIHYFS